MSYQRLGLAVSAVLLISACQKTPESLVQAPSTADNTLIKASGELAAVDSEYMAPPKVKGASRFTISFLAEDGKSVQPGQPVLIFDTQDLQNRLITKQSQLDEKRSQYERSKVNNKETLEQLRIRHEELVANAGKTERKAALPKDVLARNEFQENQLRDQLARIELAKSKTEQQQRALALETDEQITQSEIKRLEIEVADLKASIAKMTLTSRRPGIVIHQTDWRGNRYAVGDTVWGRRVAEVASLDQMAIKMEIAERDLNRVKEGQRIRFNLDANPEKNYFGVITKLAKVVRTKAANQPALVIDAIASVEDPDLEVMRPGMRINAEILTDQKQEVAGL